MRDAKPLCYGIIWIICAQPVLGSVGKLKACNTYILNNNLTQIGHYN